MTCAHCNKPYICKYGKDKVPLCQEHFDIALKYVAKLVKTVEGILS